MAIMLFIGLNMMVMAMDHYQMDPTFDIVLERLNVFFIAIFTTECVLKLFAFRWYYFKEPWNVFDFVVVSLSILGKLARTGIEVPLPIYMLERRDWYLFAVISGYTKLTLKNIS